MRVVGAVFGVVGVVGLVGVVGAVFGVAGVVVDVFEHVLLISISIIPFRLTLILKSTNNRTNASITFLPYPYFLTKILLFL